MIKQLFTETEKQPQSIILGKGTYVQTVLHTHHKCLLHSQKTPEINKIASSKFYKTT